MGQDGAPPWKRPNFIYFNIHSHPIYTETKVHDEGRQIDRIEKQGQTQTKSVCSYFVQLIQGGHQPNQRNTVRRRKKGTRTHNYVQHKKLDISSTDSESVSEMFSQFYSEHAKKKKQVESKRDCFLYLYS